jgi:hypothetical protein
MELTNSLSRNIIMESIGYNSLWKAIIRPPRNIYEYKHLGPKKL